MLKIGESVECSKSELDLFYVPPTQTAIEEGHYDDIEPHSSYETADNIRFDIPGDSAHFLNMGETELYIQGRILIKGTEEGIKEDVKLGPVNNFLHSLFSQVNINISNQNVEISNDSYALRSYLENLISFNKLEKHSCLVGDIFEKDDHGEFDLYTVRENSETQTESQLVIKNAVNSGMLKRRQRFLDGKRVQLQGKLHCDIFTMSHLMVNSTDISIILKKNKPKFYLMGEIGGREYTFKYDDCFLKIRRQVISPSVMAAIARVNEEFTYKYPIKRVIIKSKVIPESSVKISWPTICQRILPRRIIIGFLKTEAFDGSFEYNPFNFENLGITTMNLKVNSRSLPNTNGLKLDFENNQYLYGYKTLTKLSRELDITYAEYKEGYTLFSFDLNPDNCTGSHYSPLSDGTIGLEFTKEKSHSISYTCIAYLEFDNLIQLNKYRQPSFDYNI